MNKAITQGIVFTPQAFSEGLDLWSSENGTPGSNTYENAPNAAFVPSDPDFGGALELLKTETTQKLRYMVQTPIEPGCYLQVRARVKVISGAPPNVRIAAWAGRAGGAHIDNVVEVGPTTTLTNFGDVVEISAIVGTGTRPGVDMAWGPTATFGHFGLDLTGPNGGVVRVDDIQIEDITNVFLGDLVGAVDVRDYGAIGDGNTDCHAAFEAADNAADGRVVLIPEGVYRLADNVTLQSKARFEGTVTMPTNKYLILEQNFNLPGYTEAFGNAELAFGKAFQAMLKGPNQVELDMAGMKVDVRAPIDLQAVVPDITSFAQRRVIKNGQLSAVPGANWNKDVVTSRAFYTTSRKRELSEVVNVANIPVGALVQGNGVGREVYVRSKNVAQQTIELSRPLYDAAGTQTFTFTRFKYLLDFSGFNKISKFAISDIDFLCRENCNGMMLPPAGKGFHIMDCWFTSPKERGFTSPGDGDQGMAIDRCNFQSNASVLVQNRQVIGFNLNANDVKIRSNRASYFRHFAVVGGTSSIILGNHIFQGDASPLGPRMGGIIMAHTNSRATITGNYICDCSIEWTNEHDSAPEFASEFSFSGMSITNNNFLSQSTVASFNFLRVIPYGAGHFINGLTFTGNTFRLFDGNIDRVEGIDTSFATMNFARFQNIKFAHNTYSNVNVPVENPLVLRHTENSPQSTWVVEPSSKLPFNAWVQTVESVTPQGAIRDSSNSIYWGMPYCQPEIGANKNRANIRWEKPVKGTAVVRLRIDDPI